MDHVTLFRNVMFQTACTDLTDVTASSYVFVSSHFSIYYCTTITTDLQVPNRVIVNFGTKRCRHRGHFEFVTLPLSQPLPFRERTKLVQPVSDTALLSFQVAYLSKEYVEQTS